MDKPDTPGTPSFALPGHAVVSLEGRDALVFAQAQTMNDVAALEDGQWHWNGWLTAKGRVVALFALLRLDAERIWLLLPDADPQMVADGMQRFVFRSKLKIEVRDELRTSGGFERSALAAGKQLASDGHGSLELDVGTGDCPRRLRISPGGSAADNGSVERWRAFDLAHGLARLHGSQVEQWTPQQLSLHRLGAYSVKKGCYPGQEIVARTHFLGKAKRGLVLFETDSLVAAGEPVQQAGNEVGTVVSTAPSAQGGLCLAVLPVERPAGALHIGEAEAREKPLLDGLSR